MSHFNNTQGQSKIAYLSSLTWVKPRTLELFNGMRIMEYHVSRAEAKQLYKSRNIIDFETPKIEKKPLQTIAILSLNSTQAFQQTHIRQKWMSIQITNISRTHQIRPFQNTNNTISELIQKP